MSAQRGFTIAETLVVALIMGLMLFAIATATESLLSSPNRTVAKADSLSPGAYGFYQLERDLRESDAIATFACTGWPATCGVGSLSTSDSAVVIPTAAGSPDIDAPFLTQEDSGTPQWTGFIVYWQRQADGDVYRAFEPSPDLLGDLQNSLPDRSALQALAQDAVAAVTNVREPQVALHGVATLAAAINTSTHMTSMHLVATGAAGGATNTTTYDDDVLARN